MKGKQLAILLLVVAVLGGLWLLVAEHRNASWSETGGGGDKVVGFPLNDVAQIVIKSATGDLHLVKKADEWTVQERAGYPASFEEVSGFLRKLWELKRVQVVKVGPSQLPRLELVEPGKGDKAGTVVQLLGADGKPFDEVILGKKYMRKSETNGGMDLGDMGGTGGFPAGRYVKRVNGQTVAVVSQTLDEADPKPERWLSKDFIKIDGAKSISVVGQGEEQHWTLTRENATAEWKLTDAKSDEKLDTAKTSPLGSTFSAVSFNNVLAPDAKLEEPVTNVAIETFDGFHYELKIGKPVGDNYPVTVKVSGDFPKERTPGKDEKPEDKTRLDSEFAAKQKQSEEKLAKEQKTEGRPYLVARYLAEPLTKGRSDLLAPKPTPSPTPSPAAAIPAVTLPAPAAAVPPILAPPAPLATVPSAPPTPAPTPAPAPMAPVSVTTPPVAAPVPAVEAVSPPAPAVTSTPAAAATPAPTPTP